MKALFLSCLMVISMMTIAQNQNTFPSSGNVGINTSSAPSERLHVNGNARVDSCLVVRDSAIVEKDLRTKGKFTVEDEAFFLEKVTMHDKLVVAENIEGANNINVGNNLNVTGTSNLDGTVKMPYILNVNNSNNPLIEILVKMPSGDVRALDVNGLRSLIAYQEFELQTCFPPYSNNPYWLSGINKLYTVCDDVNVGIGVVDPLFKLDVDGTTRSDRILASRNSSAPTNALINGYTLPGNISELIQLGRMTGPSSYDVSFTVGNAGDVQIVNIGNQPSLSISNGTGNAVVIYNSDGDKIFQIQDDGLLRSREIRVDNNQNTWPDFVFEDDYVLRPLNDVELYIKKYKRLPGIPSAAEIDAKGINVAEMHSLQMQKIEELTLYMIQMQKQIDSLQTRVIELEKNN